MDERFDVVVIGGGGLGLSVALHLALSGRTVTIVDKGDIGAQTSPRAAGLACQVKNDDLQTRLSRESVDLLTSFSAWTGGVELAVHQAGGVKVARTPEMADAIKREMAHGEHIGIPVELISPAEARDLAPYYEFEDDIAALTYTPSDLYLDPQGLVDAYIRACVLNGVDLRPQTSVVALDQQRGEIRRVETSNGAIEAQAVVDTAGAWVDIVANRLGFRVPVVPVRHQLCVTEPVGITNEHAMVRIVECNVYMRPDRGGLMFGGYEPEPLQLDMAAMDESFDIRDLQLDFEPLRKLMEEVREQVPVLRDTEIRELRGGVPTMTADGNYIIDTVPNLENLFVVGGCNVAGLTCSPAIGQAVARMVTDGDPGIDLSSTKLERFRGRSSEELRAEAIWRYAAREQWD
ncbi:MAG: FAD-binding oxidoreductase [Solirubrobacteraceae bacterium]